MSPPNEPGAASLPDSMRDIILDQVENGVAVRMAVLYRLAAGTEA